MAMAQAHGRAAQILENLQIHGVDLDAATNGDRTQFTQQLEMQVREAIQRGDHGDYTPYQAHLDSRHSVGQTT